MISERSFWIYAAELRKVILAIGLDETGFVFHYKVPVNDPEHIGDIQNHIVRDVFEQETEEIIVKCSPESRSVPVERIRPVWFEIVFVSLDIIGDEIGAITRFEDLAADETFNAYDRVFVEPYLDIVSWFSSAQLRLSGKIKIYELFDKEIFIAIDNKSLIRNFKRIHFYDRSHFKIFFDSADKFYLLIRISVEIDGGTLESDLFPFLGGKWMSVIREIIIRDDFTGKSKGCS